MKTTARKRIILNVVMVVAILAILTAGILTVGSLQGWFGSDDSISVMQPDGTVKTMEALAQNKIGSANIQRGGVAYSLKDGNKLRNGDIIQTLNGSSIDIAFGENTISLDENSQATMYVSKAGETSMELKNGNVFASISDSFTLRMADTDISLNNGVFSASVPYGSASIYVFENVVEIDGKTIKAGNAVSILQDGIHTNVLSIHSLNAFDLAHISKANENKTLCFTNAQIEQLTIERETAMQEIAQAQILAEENAQKVEQQRRENEKNQTAAGDKNSGNTSGNTGGNTKGNTDDDRSENDDNGHADGDSFEDDDGGVIIPPDPSCTITIRCDTILDNMGNLTEGKNKYVPSNGVILATSRLSFEEDETVFDVLKQACSLAGIQLEYAWTPMYDSYYIEGINHLYEFDCGEQSGWMYKVNGWFPNYGCSSYTLKDGDVIVWTYTCKGLGADVGGGL